MSLNFEDQTRGKLINARAEINDFIDDNMEANYNRFVIPEIKAISRAANAPEAFTESFYFLKTGKNAGKIINTLGTKQKPLAKWFNYGTKRNYPITPKVQHPQGTPRAEREKEDIGGGHVSEPSVLHWIDPQTGKDMFREIVIHPGQPRTLAMEIGLRIGQKRLIAEVKNQVKNKFSDTYE
jgi:hypothetical protein